MSLQSESHASRVLAAPLIDGEPNLEPICVTPKQACAMLSIGPSSFYRLVGRGDLKTCKIGKSRRVFVSSIRALAERCAQ